MTNAGLSGLAITSGRCGVATLTIVELLARSRFKSKVGAPNRAYPWA